MPTPPPDTHCPPPVGAAVPAAGAGAPPARPRNRDRRRPGRLLTATGVSVAVLVAGLAGPAAAAARPARSASVTAVVGADRARAARWGAGWLADQITANGGHLDAFGAADVPDTAYAVLGLHAVGVGAAAGAQAIAYLKTQLGAALHASDGSDSPGTLAYYVLAAVASGADPRHFGGRAPVNDLVARLLATARTVGPDTGLFGSADPTFDGAFRQGLALAALRAARVPVTNPAVAAGLSWLARQQCPNGTWAAYRADPVSPCPVVDPATFTGADTNSRSMAVQGLAAYGNRPQAQRLLATLHSIQSADGGWGYLATAAQPSDPDSTAMTIQAIIAEGGNPGTSWWAPTGTNPYGALAAFQLGCADPAGDRGAFFFPGARTANVFATVQAVPAMARVALPLKPSALSAAVPIPSCGATTGGPGPSRPVSARPGRGGTRPPVASGALPRAGHPGACQGRTGVTVAVDFTAFGKGVQVRCAPGTPATGIAALKEAGFSVAGTAAFGLAFVCRIQALPSPAQQACLSTPPPTAYWSYYHALAGATTWAFSSVGAASYAPPQGSIDAWAFGATAKPTKSPAQVRAS